MGKNNTNFYQREKYYLWWAIGLSVVGCFLLVAALYMAPIGLIDPSVISAAGTIFLFAGSIVGIRGSFDTKLMKFENEIQRSRNANTQSSDDETKSSE